MLLSCTYGLYLEFTRSANRFAGDLAQLVARVLSMHKVAGSIPAISIFY